MKKILPVLLLLFSPALAEGAACTTVTIGAYTCVQANGNNTGTTSTTVALTNHAAGNLLAVFYTVADSNASVTLTITNTQGYTWSNAIGPVRRTGNTVWSEIFYTVIPSGFTGTDTITCADATATGSLCLAAELNGTRTTTPLDGTGGSATGTSTTPATGNYTVTTGSLAFGGTNGSGGISAGSGWSAIFTTAGMLIQAQVAASTTVNSTASQPASNPWVALGTGFLSNAAAATVVPQHHGGVW